MKIAIFAPHNSIWVWGLFLSYFGRAFKSCGYEIDFISCNGDVEYCTAMIGLSPASNSRKKANVCKFCKRNARWLASSFNFNHITIETLAKSDKLNIFEKDVEDKIGAYAFYETILTYKTYGNFTPEMIEMKNAYHNGNRIIYAAAESYFKNNKPDLTLVWNGLYSFDRTWMLAAEKKNVPAYWINAGGNRGFEFQTIMFGTKNWYAYNAEQKENWTKAEPNIRTKASDARIMAALIANIIFAKTIFTYSKPKQNLHYRQSKKIGKRKLIVMPTSSQDELLSAKAVGAKVLCNNIFQEQTEWVQFILDRFSESKDYFIVLRVHPRDFPNQRENKHSEYSVFYYSLYEKYKNSDSIHINLPQDNISLYDLFEEAALVLNGWSSAGEEAGLLGIPVVSAFQDYCNYPGNLEPSYADRLEYLNLIQKEINAGWSAQRALRFLKWRVFSTLQCEITLSHEYLGNMGSRLPFKDRLLAKRMIRQMKSEQFEDILHYFKINNKYRETIANENCLGDDEILKQYFQYIYDALYKKSENPPPNTLQKYIRNFLIHN
ncbi:MAG: hypothetical protein FD156_93 [Nitrospirae bacterium]|nr:MAG: hypothetical protein FD156_93 [Nitrospirota bacterium]